MSCPGLHCPSCTEGQSIAITGGAVAVLVLAAETIQWVAERVFWVGGTMAACLALSVAASFWLERMADRRGARFAAEHGILSRADVIRVGVVEICEPLPHSRSAGRDRELVTTARPAIEPRPAIHLHFHGVPGEQAAEIIRQALPGESVTEETRDLSPAA